MNIRAKSKYTYVRTAVKRRGQFYSGLRHLKMKIWGWCLGIGCLTGGADSCFHGLRVLLVAMDCESFWWVFV